MKNERQYEIELGVGVNKRREKYSKTDAALDVIETAQDTYSSYSESSSGHSSGGSHSHGSDSSDDSDD